MIPARKSALFTRWFARDAEMRIRRAFSAVHVCGLEHLERQVKAGPTVVVTNHTAWWDPLVALVASHRWVDADGYAMMDASNLERLPFFGRVGAFGVDLGDPSDGARAMRHAAKLLARPNALVWIFAQGREVPVTVRPLGFRPGSREIARIAKAAVVPGAIRYEMGSVPEPALWLSFGPAIEHVRAGVEPELHEKAVTEELDRVERAIGGDAAGFTLLHRKPESRILALATRLLAFMTKPRGLRLAPHGDSTSAPSRSTRNEAPRQ